MSTWAPPTNFWTATPLGQGSKLCLSYSGNCTFAVFVTKYRSQSVSRLQIEHRRRGRGCRLRKFVWPFSADDWRLVEATDRKGLPERNFENYFGTFRRRLLKIYINWKSYFFMLFLIRRDRTLSFSVTLKFFKHQFKLGKRKSFDKFYFTDFIISGVSLFKIMGGIQVFIFK